MSISPIPPVREYYGTDPYFAYLIGEINKVEEAKERLLRETQPVFAMPPPEKIPSVPTSATIHLQEQRNLISEVPKVERYSQSALRDKRRNNPYKTFQEEFGLGRFVDILV